MIQSKMISTRICRFAVIAGKQRGLMGASNIRRAVYLPASAVPSVQNALRSNFIHTQIKSGCGKCVNCTCGKSMSTAAPYVKGDKKDGLKYETQDLEAGDHLGRQQNHIWTREEIKYHLENQPHHKPKTVADYLARRLVSAYSSYC